MGGSKLHKIEIDLDKFEIKLIFSGFGNPFIAQFNTPNRKFFCSLVAFIVVEMKMDRQKKYINIKTENRTATLRDIDIFFLGENASSDENRLGKCRKAWNNRLPKTEEGLLFKVKERPVIKLKGQKDTFVLESNEGDVWCGLFRHDDNKSSFKFRFACEDFGVDLDEVAIIYNESDEKAWERFVHDVSNKPRDPFIKTPSIERTSGVIKYLEAFCEKIKFDFNRTYKCIYGFKDDLTDRAYDELYIPVNITTNFKYRFEPESLSSIGLSEEEQRKAYSNKGVEPNSINSEPWDKVKTKFEGKNLTILADPGMGKTTFLQLESSKFTNNILIDLADGRISDDDVEIPIFIKLFDLAKSSDELIDAIPILIKRDYRKIWCYIEHLIYDKLESGKFVLFLDALDEVTIKLREELRKKLDRFYNDYQGRIICTSRLVGYPGFFLIDSTELEIVPFNKEQIEDYIKIWHNIFGTKDTSTHYKDRLLNEIKNKPQIFGLAQNPLLLSILCRLYPELNYRLPARRCLLYEKTINLMLGKWSSLRKPQSESRVACKKRFLKIIAYKFTLNNKQIFSLEEDLLLEANNFLEKYPKISKFQNADELLTEITVDDGVLVPIDPDKTRFIFSHRTFHEFLTASYLLEFFNSDYNRGINIIKQHIWDFDWHVTLSLLSGLLRNPIPLIKYIYNQKDDIFYSMLVLSCLLISECIGKNHVLFTEIIRKIYRLWKASKQRIDYLNNIVITLAQTNHQMFNLLVKAIKYEKDSLTKAMAVRVFGKIADPEATAILITALDNENNWVRRLAAEHLGYIGNTEAIIPLIRVLDDSDILVRWEAAGALGRIDEHRVSKALIEALKNKNHQVKFFSIHVLGDISKPDVTLALIELLKCSDQKLRIEVINSLQKIRDRKSINALIHLLNDDDPAIKTLSASALGHIKDPKATHALTTAIKDNNEHVREYAARALCKISNPKATNALIKALDDPSDTVRHYALRTLGNIGNPNLTGLCIKALSDNHAFVRGEAAKCLGKIGGNRATEFLKIALQDSDKDVKRRAIEALANIGTPSVIDPLIKTLQDKEESIRAFTLEVLGKTNSEDIIGALIKTLKNKQYRFRHLASLALGEIGDSSSISALVEAIEDKDILIRTYAASALGDTGNKKVVGALIKALSDSYYKVRMNAAESLGKIGTPSATDPLIRALYDDNKFVVERAASALGAIGDPNAVEALINTLYHSHLIARYCAVDALPKIKGPKGVLGLAEALKNDNFSVRIKAAHHLLHTNYHIKNTVLLEALKDKNQNVRMFVAKLLMRNGDLYSLKKIIESKKIDIYEDCTFLLLRSLMIKFSREQKNKEVTYLPVYPDLVINHEEVLWDNNNGFHNNDFYFLKQMEL